MTSGGADQLLLRPGASSFDDIDQVGSDQHVHAGGAARRSHHVGGVATNPLGICPAPDCEPQHQLLLTRHDLMLTKTRNTSERGTQSRGIASFLERVGSS
jgi:hypothetical protein